MRNFEKISWRAFSQQIIDDKEMYENYLLPSRASKSSAGYDFFALKDYVIKPGEIVKIPTGYKAKFNENEVLFLILRSSLGFKYNLRLTNQVGVIDRDYYNNSGNEGHIYVSIQNEGNKEFVLRQNEAYVQGIFVNYLLTDDDKATNDRIGGIGSTNKEKEG